MSIKNFLFKKKANSSEKKVEEIKDMGFITSKLEKATLNFFPETGSWNSGCFNRPNDLCMGNLPCHLRDDEWLAQLLRMENNLIYISYNDVLHFVKISPLFEEKRHEYELEIVRWQIDWMRNGGENWIIDENYGGDFVFLTPVCDLGFRKGVVDTLTRIGMDEEVIEEGIEKFSDNWRRSFIESAFRNKFESYFYSFDTNCPLPPADEEHREKWIQYRLYEYYQEHKKSVDAYGSIVPEMMLTDEEAKELSSYLEIKNAERLQIIEKYKESKGYAKMLKKTN